MVRREDAMESGEIHKRVPLLNTDQIQVIASNSYSHPRTIDFGAAQNPELTDYADGVDVLEFLKQI